MFDSQIGSLLALVALVASNPHLQLAPSARRIPAGTTFTSPQPYTRYDRGGDADPVFLLEEGATLSLVVIGANQADGIHCLGSCTLDNVWFEVTTLQFNTC
ncbi:unnamed protein product [Cyclocybe aegerita]|uniref:Pectate lyase n=1 Tax=Cyclocybe aegerita TaxID=1973307 RepID=A0A8S0X2Z0_CYCAE|nr:unnamed protein product [Cyclocybe aegerita]